jgi:Tol biopolymer transport system component
MTCRTFPTGSRLPVAKRRRRTLAAAAVTCVVVLASGSPLRADVDDQFSGWSEPEHLGPPNRDGSAEQGASVSRDGLTLYFTSTRPGGLGGFDIWVSQRAREDEAWGEPVNLGPAVNSPADDVGPALTSGGDLLFFQSNRPGSRQIDLYVARRCTPQDDCDWRAAENLGPGVNSAVFDITPAPFEDDETGAITLYFASNRPGGLGRVDIYATTLEDDETLTFGPVVHVKELSSDQADQTPEVRWDGLELFLASDRAGTLGGPDLWVATRASTSDPWSTPENLGAPINSPCLEAGPSLSSDATVLHFQSGRPRAVGDVACTDNDLYTSTRTKLTGPD